MSTPARTAVLPPPLCRVLRRGMRGDDVRYMQTILQSEGYFEGTPLGNFLTLTRAAVVHFQTTHIDEDGEFLVGDGVVGNKTWWALHNAHGPAQRNFIPIEPGLDEVEAALEVGGTLQPVGVRQRLLVKLYEMYASNIREIPNGANYGDGVTPIVNACGFRYGIPWCMAALSYAWRDVTGSSPIGAMHVHVATFWNEAHARGMAHRKASYTPIPGDFAIYNYGSGLSPAGRLTGSGHAAAVARVSRDGAQFNALEGNVSNRFKHSIRNRSERTLIGYVNLHGDEADPPRFEQGVTQAPVIAASYADTR